MNDLRQQAQQAQATCEAAYHAAVDVFVEEVRTALATPPNRPLVEVYTELSTVVWRGIEPVIEAAEKLHDADKFAAQLDVMLKTA